MEKTRLLLPSFQPKGLTMLSLRLLEHHGLQCLGPMCGLLFSIKEKVMIFISMKNFILERKLLVDFKEGGTKMSLYSF